jgi:hypothetical protein
MKLGRGAMTSLKLSRMEKKIGKQFPRKRFKSLGGASMISL